MNELPKKTKTYERRPIQLIRVSDDLKRFEVDREGLRVIQEIEGEVGVAAVCGSQRTGKSFLLNLLIGLDSKDGVGFGS
jgi:polynucleotide 5'-kinase involved in rRNA processing